MKTTLISIILISFFSFCFAQKNIQTEIYVIGNIHDSVPNYTSKILFGILDKIKPDLILHEVDKKGMKEYIEARTFKENEIKASNLYLSQYPKTARFPFDFEGRNQYRKDHGMVPTDNLTVKLIDSLYKTGALNAAHSVIYKHYLDLTQKLMGIAELSPEHFNNKTTDAISKARQEAQYKELVKIVDERPEFLSNTVIKPNGEKITYREGFNLMCGFWDLRNRSMAKNIYEVTTQYKGKRIVVLTGFLHRYYIISELKRLNHGNYIIKEFYDL
ncbi:hypothetical protein [Pedobacter miscanthi]|jgi:hypothetical protein|uniref:hypothetical protein n=1 Tax=Pedobacter miscanthi TaxID=2259170 RepID=UPI00292EE6F8|nr:hypothetical protein [Pedobacter miscanthi]